ncbi:hypothetical protein BCV69DRAFT_172233 [Microstroma glucosiphilum]|uniref:Uncharacterized protein n=1 Tax=Pseudomicrostroma glucosiphilum TaxID=1684307 RepID=A0A316U8H1_9BASI|nr:hypothetical protein BCV69DRAFT_172233 [Pseudomicrostroma glucosiphilum]PWN21506.1 hypothetical protein BCV69DRAFT_172233 [Pseudomicrostroma glucosiphilum]
MSPCFESRSCFRGQRRISRAWSADIKNGNGNLGPQEQPLGVGRMPGRSAQVPGKVLYPANRSTPAAWCQRRTPDSIQIPTPILSGSLALPCPFSFPTQLFSAIVSRSHASSSSSAMTRPSKVSSGFIGYDVGLSGTPLLSVVTSCCALGFLLVG